MPNRRHLLSLAAAVAICLSVLTAAGPAFTQGTEGPIKVGVRGGVDEEIFEVVTKVAARNGLKIDPVVITGSVSPNEALNTGDLNANAFQHVPYLNSQVKARGYKITSVANTYVSPIAIYSKKVRNPEELAAGARIGIPDDVPNQTRALLVLDRYQLIRLKDGIDRYSGTITLADVAANPKGFKLVELPSTVLARTFEELDAAVIVNSFASQVGLLATRDGIALEPKDANPYINVIAVREQDKSAPWLPGLIAAYQSSEVRDFITKKYEGSVLPAF